ncbi:MAG: hypothetical protein KF884_03130 [Fimbriimonadaceae bacterium]|nr:hypothetical protein [Fimbriimonadaceae bacterium]QYK59088.1 MAG: hypothetical protein KF884_03130 [Fimbriimonadaceae bacterium]
MRNLTLLSAALMFAAAFGQTPVSGFDFDGTLNPYLDNNPPNVFPLEHRTGGSPTAPFGPTVFVSDTVGTTTKQVAKFDAPQFFRVLHGMKSNGGGDYVNLYTLVIDVKFVNPAIGSFSSLYNSNDDNRNDGDTFIRWDDNGFGSPIGKIGISGQYNGEIQPNVWNRIVLTYDATIGTFIYYVNGTVAQTVTGAGVVDGRWALYGYEDLDVYDHYDLFGDNDGDNGSGFVSLLVNYDTVLTAAQVAALGPVGTRIGGATSETIAPDALTLQRGQIVSGTIANLAVEDNVALRLKKFFVANPVEPFVWGTLQGTTSILNPSSVTFRVKSRMVTGGQFSQEIEQFNWSTSLWENKTETNPFNTIYGTRESVANPATNKVNGSGRLQARIRTFPRGISANPLPETDWDLVNWTVNP